jgi:dTMP kinase
VRGKFITVEGGEGAGKSTQIAFIRQCIENAGKRVIVTREPGGTAVGEQIRAVLLNPDNTQLHSDTELLLMFAARAQHLRELIEPALAQGAWVVSDRFTDATYAYQGGGRGIDTSRIAVLESWVQGELNPDLTLLLDLPVEVGMERARLRGKYDRFETEQRAFFERVRTAYLQRAEQQPQRFRVVDASQNISGVQAALSSILSEYLA